jgi:hypothetical protein
MVFMLIVPQLQAMGGGGTHADATTTSSIDDSSRAAPMDHSFSLFFSFFVVCSSDLFTQNKLLRKVEGKEIK